MDKLSKYLLEHIQIDFTGDIDPEAIKKFLREDNSKEANQLLSKIMQEGIDDLLIVVADCLKERLAEGINENSLKEELISYGEA
jgi:hypothetical protein